ncbi:MAG: SufB/SufD family protein [Phycisphaerae bacterium]
MKALDELVSVANIHAAAKDPDTAHLVIGLNEVISSRSVPGLEVETTPVEEGVKLRFRVADGAKIAKPVHLCFGLLQEQGIQRINILMEVGKGASIEVMAHCVFPYGKDIQHLMDAEIVLAEGAKYSYFERHIHSDYGGVVVVPHAKVHVGADARFKTDFELIEGRVGRIDIDYETTVEARGVMEMTAKVSGRADDSISIRETGHLVGEKARGVLTSRVAVRQQAHAEIYNKLTASAAFARGHVDCREVVLGDAFASAVPIVEVNNPKAHVTHEAALGSVDRKQLETLMARGLNEDEASDTIIAGLLS